MTTLSGHRAPATGLHTRAVGYNPQMVATGAHTLAEPLTAHGIPESVQRRLDLLEDKVYSLRAFLTGMLVVVVLFLGVLLWIVTRPDAAPQEQPPGSSVVVEEPSISL